MKRVFHHYLVMEEYRDGMWRNVPTEDREGYISATAQLMREPERFYQAMLRAVREWRYSCEHNLTARMINKRAWLGHAGCLLATGSPEDCTRLGWHRLTPTEQDAANAAADRAYAAWESLYIHLRANPTTEVYGGPNGGQEERQRQSEAGKRAEEEAVFSAGMPQARGEGREVADLRGPSPRDT